MYNYIKNKKGGTQNFNSVENTMKGKMKFVTTMILVGLVPALLIATTLCLFSISRVSNSLEEEVYQRLHVAAEGLNEYYAWDIINKGEPAYEHDYVDSLKDQEIELTLFMGNKRFITSIVDASTGKRNEGTEADSAIYQEVASGKSFKADGVVIGGREYYVYYTPVKDAAGKVVGMAFAGEPESAVTDQINAMSTGLILMTVILVAVMVVIVVLFAFKIKKPIVSIVEETNNLARGELGHKIELKSSIKEIAVLIQAATELQENLSSIISDVNGNVNILDQKMGGVAEGVDICNQASEGIVQAVDDLSKGTLDMAESVQNCTTSMQEIGDSITEITKHASVANEDADDVRAESSSAKEKLGHLMNANANTIEISQQVVDGITEASKATAKIREVTEMITDIASETKLLSLNASIEAARAGEAGAGFAVVATSIQSLADQSDESAQEIQKVINEIMVISNNNVKLADEIREAVNNEGTVLQEVDQSFERVEERISETANAISIIRKKSIQLDEAKVAVLDEVTNLSAVSEENAASCEETNASMEELRANVEIIYQQSVETKGVSTQLSDTVSYFKE